MQLSILGAVLVNGRAPRGAKERALLTRLLVAPGAPVPAETLIEAAWPPHPGDGVTRSLHVRLAKLRALLAPGPSENVIVREPGGYALKVDSAAVDAHRFVRLADRAGPFRLEDAERVGGGDGLDHDAVLDLLVALTEHSMVPAESGSPRRFRMLEALRDHGRARLDDRAAEAAARRHARHFAQLAVTIASEVDRRGAEAVGDPLVPYHWDVDAASRWAIAHAEADLARSTSPRARARSTTWSGP